MRVPRVKARLMRVRMGVCLGVCLDVFCIMLGGVVFVSEKL